MEWTKAGLLSLSRYTLCWVPPRLALLPATTATDGRHHPLCAPLTEVSTEPAVRMSHSITLIKTNDKEWLLGFHNVFCIIKLVNCIAQNKWAE